MKYDKLREALEAMRERANKSIASSYKAGYLYGIECALYKLGELDDPDESTPREEE